MLVLTRKEGEEIRIGDNTVVRILSIKGNKIRIGIEAPENIKIKRGELATKEAEPHAKTA